MNKADFQLEQGERQMAIAGGVVPSSCTSGLLCSPCPFCGVVPEACENTPAVWVPHKTSCYLRPHSMTVYQQRTWNRRANISIREIDEQANDQVECQEGSAAE